VRLITLGTLVTRAKELIDAENQGNITDTTWKAWISRMYGRLHHVVASTGYRYFESVQTINADGLNTFFSLPADHYASGTIIRLVSEDDRRRLTRASAQETAYMPQGTAARLGSEATRWAHVAQQVFLSPKPPAGQVYEHRYIPQPADLTAGDDALDVDVINSDGESMILEGAAVKGLLKQDKDPRFHRDEYAEALKGVLDWAQQRSFFEKHTVDNDPAERGTMGLGFRDAADWTDRHGGF
jgi:hypothetical protein